MKDFALSYNQKQWEFDIDRYERSKKCLIEYSHLMSVKQAEYWLGNIYRFLKQYPQFKEF